MELFDGSLEPTAAPRGIIRSMCDLPRPGRKGPPAAPEMGEVPEMAEITGVRQCSPASPTSADKADFALPPPAFLRNFLHQVSRPGKLPAEVESSRPSFDPVRHLDTTAAEPNDRDTTASMEFEGQSAEGSVPASPAESTPTGAVIKRRAPMACRRCRRMRSKCVHQGAIPPCDACRDAGLPAGECVFQKRGLPDNDREYRHPRRRSEKGAVRRDPAKVRREILEGPNANQTPLSSLRTILRSNEWDCLPPLDEIIESVHMFTRHYFQLGFIPKTAFPERLKQNHGSVSVFFLLGILSISARFTPSLVGRYGDGMKAAELFMERGSTLALNELYLEPTLERCQAFYLLGIAQQGSGYKNKSYINLGVAMRMAALMRLHREETYALPPNPPPELVTRAESARRTLWMLHSQDNLHSGPSSPVSLTERDITALLPSNEEDFALGREPKSRAALEGTPPAIANPSLIYGPHRSLFASLIQTHHLWGMISRRAVRQDKSARPWDNESDFALMKKKLDDWERNLPKDHTWSPVLLKGYRMSGQGLAFLGVTTVTRLCNIIIRKAYLDNIIHRDQAEPQTRDFWAGMSDDLFRNVKDLFQQIDTHFTDRAPDDGIGAQMSVFCVYSCGIMASYLCKYPTICSPMFSRNGPAMLQRTASILAEGQSVWPLASRWLEGLTSFASDKKAMVGYEGSMADGRDPIPHALHPSLSHSSEAPGPPTTPLDDKRKMRRQSLNVASSPSSSTALLPPPPVPMPDMYIDPSIRLPAPQPHQGQAQPQPGTVEHAPPPPQHPDAQAANRANNLDLLVQASFDSRPAVSAPYNHPAGPHGPPDYYGQPAHIATNDGYEHELQYYLDGAPNMQNPVWGSPGMYGQYQ